MKLQVLSRRTLWSGSFLVIQTVLGFPPCRTEEPRIPDPIAQVDKSHIVGPGGCSARACHGGLAVKGQEPWRSAYTTWMTRDKKHSSAFAPLRTGWSKSIAAKLGRPSGGGGATAHAP